jgi:opacity protein-like surface antigen
MKRVVFYGSAFAVALGLAAQPSLAADMPQYPPPVVVPQPVPVPVVADFEGWYLRGDIGITNQKVKSLHNVLFDTAPGFGFIDDPAFGTGILMGLGFGYHWNNWLRFDITGEYRGKTQFHALDRYSGCGAQCTNDYTAKKSEWLVLANAYVDLGTWWCITPFIGAGVGMVDITISHFRDRNDLANGGGYAPEGSKRNFAWALHAGLGYNVSQNFTVEFAYRYLNLGDAETGDPLNLDGSNSTVNNPFVFNGVTSHDFKIGLRFALDPGPGARFANYASPPAYTPPPAYMPPPQQVLTVPPTYAPPPPQQYAPQYAPPPTYVQPQYAPPPAYAPPPLQRKG